MCNIETLVLFLSGTGLGLIHVTSLVAVSFHFPQSVTVATGICICGTGLGMFIHPPLLQVHVALFANLYIAEEVLNRRVIC